MNIHEHQAKEILKEFGAPVSNGVVVTSINEIPEKIKKPSVRRQITAVETSEQQPVAALSNPHRSGKAGKTS